MELFKIVQSGNKVFIKMLTHNDRIWSERQWGYSWVRTGTYPTNMEEYATDFKTLEVAQKWIKEHSPAQTDVELAISAFPSPSLQVAMLQSS